MLLYGPRFFGTEPEVFIQPVVFPKCPRILYLLSWKSTLKILLPSQTRKNLFFLSDTGDGYDSHQCFLPFTPEGFIRTVVLQKGLVVVS